jgi:hypothetical protein
LVRPYLKKSNTKKELVKQIKVEALSINPTTTKTNKQKKAKT